MSAVIAISRFRVPGDPSGFEATATEVVAHFQGCPGSRGAELVRNLDEPELWALLSRRSDVGSSRRAFNGTPAKLLLIPLPSLAIDEPSAFAAPADVGENRPRGSLS